jgi:predicted TIM-barrel fold metal-dependent hydrolase
MIIDGHAHLAGEYRDLQSILATLDATGVDKVIICPAEKERPESMPIPGLTGRIAGGELNFVINRLLRVAADNDTTRHYIDSGNEEVFNISRLSGGRVIQFYWADPLREGIIDELRLKISLWGIKGIKLHQSCTPFTVLSEPFHKLAEFAATENIPVFIHLHSKKELADFISVSGNYKTNFITGHLIGLEIFISQRKRVSDNIYFDISCPPLVPVGRIRKAMKTFGAGRLLMGSDTPYGRNNVRQAVSHIRCMKISELEKEMILGNNMKDLLMI